MNIYRGHLVRLGTEDPQILAEAFSRWGRDTEYMRLLDDAPARPWSVNQRKQWLEKDLENPTHGILFSIRSLAEDKLIGFVSLWEISWSHSEAWVGIGIGERDYWGKGYGSEAMQLVLRYAFSELNLHRVSLGVFSYNPRAIRSYEKCGFRQEGVINQAFVREGQRWDLINMGILRREWQNLYSEQNLLPS